MYGAKGLAILGLIWFIYGGYRTAYLGQLFGQEIAAAQVNAEIEKLKAGSNDKQYGYKASKSAENPIKRRATSFRIKTIR